MRWFARRARRLAGPRCLARSCPLPKVDGMSKWCRDHTDAILAGAKEPSDPTRRAMARRLGARRWLLLAEVKLEQEHALVDVVEGAAAQSPDERRFNRGMWEYPNNGIATVVSPTLAERVDQLVALEPPVELTRAVEDALHGVLGSAPDPALVSALVDGVRA